MEILRTFAIDAFCDGMSFASTPLISLCTLEMMLKASYLKSSVVLNMVRLSVIAFLLLYFLVSNDLHATAA